MKDTMQGSISHNSLYFRRFLNWFFISFAGGRNRPPIMQTRDVFPQGLAFERRFDEVQREIDLLLQKRKLTRYQDIDPARAAEVSQDWRLYYAYFLWKENESARADLPVTLEIVKNIPHAINVTVAVLEPGVELAAHEGPYAGVLRYHLGIRVPKENPPSIRVLDQHYTWKAGESIVIDDVYNHEVFNKSDDVRVILMVDFMRPMNPVAHVVNRLCLRMKNKWGRHMIEKAMAQ
ncbi:MAG: aspartyl/asparaginyl beta-hydroxylase domain-containing protein [Ramlibacter sp.]|nr:aspartyl/asparaginyl beta-hydroxylase domain-containing protein [Ramlibacter sp.]